MKDSRFISQSSDGKYTINSGMPEFGYELIATLPYAYHLHKKGLLKKTVSASDTKSLYFFSPEHLEVAQKRDWENVVKLEKAGFPSIQIHRSQLDWDAFEPPPFQKYYEEKKIVFDKPTVVITNRKNVEWRGDPINFIDDDTLAKLIEMLAASYQIVYLDPADFGAAYEDHSEFVPTGLRENANVLTLGDLRRLYPGLSVNELQCRLYAGCSKFISSNGGLGILCSYFGGENIIFSRLCRELDEEVNSFHSWYYRLSKASVSLVKTEGDLLRMVEDKWVKNRPLFNVLIRAGGRPNFFHDCIRSVYDQDYGNINIYVSVDDSRSLEYVRRHRCAIVNVDTAPPKKGLSHTQKCEQPDAESVHLKHLLSCANTGYVVYLDEDGMLRDAHALSHIAALVERTQADILCWRTALADRVVPSKKNWDKHAFDSEDISKMGVCHSVGIKPGLAPSSSARGCLAQYLNASRDRIEWIDRTFSGSQPLGSGEIRTDKDKVNISISSYTNVAVIMIARNAARTLERCLDTICANGCGDGVRVIVGVNGCAKTYRVAKRLTRKYNGQVSFYNTGQQIVDTWVLRKTLIKKLYRRDTLVFFAHTGDMLPRNFFKDGIKEYNRLVSRSGFFGALRPGIWNVDNAFVESAAMLAGITDDERTARVQAQLAAPGSADVRKLLLSGMLHSKRSRSYQKLFLAHMRTETMLDRYNEKNGRFEKLLELSEDSFFCSFEGFWAMGLGNETSGPSTGLFDRIKAAMVEVEAPKNTVWFVRTISEDAGVHQTQSIEGEGAAEVKKPGVAPPLSIVL